MSSGEKDEKKRGEQGGDNKPDREAPKPRKEGKLVRYQQYVEKKAVEKAKALRANLEGETGSTNEPPVTGPRDRHDQPDGPRGRGGQPAAGPGGRSNQLAGQRGRGRVRQTVYAGAGPAPQRSPTTQVAPPRSRGRQPVFAGARPAPRGPPPAQLAGQKRRYDFPDLSDNPLSERLVSPADEEVEFKYKRGRILDMQDAPSTGPNAPNIVPQDPTFMQSYFLDGDDLEERLVPTWKQKNGGVIPPTFTTMQVISARARRAWRTPTGALPDREKMGILDEEDIEPPRIGPTGIMPPPPPRPRRKRNKSKKKPRTHKEPEVAGTSGDADDVPMEGTETTEGTETRREEEASRVPASTTRSMSLSRFGSLLLGDPPRRPADPQTPLRYPAQRIICGNCQKPGHQLLDCPGPVDADGFIPGCPRHNTKEHSIDSCLTGKDDEERHRLLVNCRPCLPPFRTEYSWPEMVAKYVRYEPHRHGKIGYPLTREFSKKIPAEAIEAYNFSDPIPGQLGFDPRTSTLPKLLQNLDSLKESEKIPGDVVMAGAETEAPAEVKAVAKGNAKGDAKGDVVMDGQEEDMPIVMPEDH